MVFLLDNALKETFVSNDGGGEHALYDWICWEYLVGKDASPHNFTQLDLRQLGEARAIDKIYTTARDAATGVQRAIIRFDEIVTRWCFPSRTFVFEVVTYLYRCLCQVMKWCEVERRGTNAFEKTQWDSNNEFSQVFYDLYKSVQNTKFVPDKGKEWERKEDFKEWLKSIQADWTDQEENEKFDPLITSTFFNYNHERKFPGESLVASLVRHLKGFVAMCADKRLHRFQEQGPKAFAKISSSYGGTLFKPTEFWWYLNPQREVKHSINKAPRCNYVDIGSSPDARGFLADLKGCQELGSTYDDKLLKWAMVLSGYGPGKLADVLNRHGAYCKDNGLRPFSCQALGLATVDFVGRDGTPLTMGKGKRILAQNWQTIKKDIKNTVREKMGTVTESRMTYATGGGRGKEEKKLDAGMVPSDTVVQPKGSDPLEPKSEADKDGGMTYLLAGAAAVVGFLLFSRG